MPPSVRRSLAAISVALALSALLVAVLRADQNARPDPLLIDFAALGKDGRPLVDLRPEDVTVKIDGKTRAVRSLRLVQIGSPLSANGVPTPFGSNDAAEVGRSLYIVIDDESILPGNERNAKESLLRFLGILSPRDRVGLITVPVGGVHVGLTTDHNRVRQQLQLFVGRASRNENDSEAACRSRQTLQALASLLGTTRAEEGPLTIIFFSSSLVGGRGAEAPVLGVPNSMLMSRRCELNPEEFERVAREAAGARAFFYVIQTDVIGGVGSAAEPVTAGAAIPRASANPRAGLEHLAGVTGGKLFHLTNSEGDTLNRIVRETSAIYLASVEPEMNERNGAPHQLSVRLGRPDSEVRSRPDVIIPRPSSIGAPPAPAPETANDLLTLSRVFRDLPVRGIGYPHRAPDGNIVVLSMLEPLDRTATMQSAAIGLYDAGGRLVNRWSAQSADLNRKVFGARLLAPPGIYRLRVAAIDTNGRAGTADYEVTAELESAGPLKLGALVLGLSRNGTFEPRLQYTTEPVAMAYVEIYGRPEGAGSTISLAFELATSLNGPALVTMPGVVSATEEKDKFVVNAAIPIGGLTAGDYVVRAIIGLESQPAGRVFRAFRKVG